MEAYETADEHHPRQSLPSQQLPSSSSSDDEYSQNPIMLDTHDSIVPLTNILNELVQLKYFLLTGPAQLGTPDGIHRHTLPNKDQISCVVWKNVYFITGTDIVRCLSFRFEAFGREISNRKKFEEGIFSDLRNLKCDNDAVLEQPKSEFLDYLYRNNCVRTQKKQKIFYWFSVNHDRLFQDALERDLKKELSNKKSSTTPVRDPAISFQYDGSRTLHDQLPDIIEKFPRPLAELADASSIMSNLPMTSNHMMPGMPSHFAPTMPYQMMPPGEVPILVNQPPVLQSNGIPFYPSHPEMVVPSEGMMIPMQHQQPPGHYMIPYQIRGQIPPGQGPQNPHVQSFASPTIPPHAIPAPKQFSAVEESTVTHQTQEQVDDHSDFPLDYVDPAVSSLGIPAQLFDQTKITATPVPDISQGYFYDEQYQEGFNGQVVPQEYLQSSYPPPPSDPAITYDNQQFQVVYHQDEHGSYTPAMIPTSSLTPVLESSKADKETATTPLPSEEHYKKTTPQHNLQNQRAYTHQSSSPRSSPKKSIRIKDEQLIQRPTSAGSTGSSSRIPAALQAKKLHAKITKSPQRATSRSSTIPTSGYDSRSEYQSATYFMPTPSESGCSDLTSFPQDSEFSESHSSVLGGAFRKPSSETASLGHVHPADLNTTSGPLNVFKTGRVPMPRRVVSMPRTVGPDGMHQPSNTKRSVSNMYHNQSPALSEFDDTNPESSNSGDIFPGDISADENYLYSQHYAQDGVDDWL